MSKRNENVIKKNEKKVKRRVKFPKSSLDYYVNFILDYKNLIRRIKKMGADVEKIEWEAHQMKDGMSQAMKLLKVYGLLKKDIDKEDEVA